MSKASKQQAVAARTDKQLPFLQRKPKGVADRPFISYQSIGKSQAASSLPQFIAPTGPGQMPNIGIKPFILIPGGPLQINPIDTSLLSKADAKKSSKIYIDYYKKEIGRGLLEYMKGVDIPTGSEFAWWNPDAGYFMDRLFRRIAHKFEINIWETLLLTLAPKSETNLLAEFDHARAIYEYRTVSTPGGDIYAKSAKLPSSFAIDFDPSVAQRLRTCLEI